MPQRADLPVQIVFGTPLLTVMWPDTEILNQELAALITAKAETESTVTQSNYGGWQSAKTFQDWQSSAVTNLLSLIDMGVYLLLSQITGENLIEKSPKNWITSAWANINRKHDYNSPHSHASGFWSGVYYVSVPEGDAGAIVLQNPSLAPFAARVLPAPAMARQAFQKNVSILPRPGMMLIFPSWIEHWVKPNLSEGPRISVAFDISY